MCLMVVNKSLNTFTTIENLDNVANVMFDSSISKKEVNTTQVYKNKFVKNIFTILADLS